MSPKKLILAALTAMVASLTAEAEEHTVYYYQRASLFDALPVDSTDIVMLGNSITDGCEWNELFRMPNVINRGISGDIVDGVRERLDPIVAGHPAKIFLMIGVNDVSHNLTADSIAGAIVSLADEIIARTPGTRLYVESCLPINNKFGVYKRLAGKEEVVREINARLAAELKKRPVTFIDSYSRFADSEGNLRAELTNDGLHLMGPGYLLRREILLPYVLE